MGDNRVYNYNILVVGDAKSGKSELINGFDQDKSFTDSYSATIGIGITSRNIVSNGKRIKLTIIDAAGKERYLVTQEFAYQSADAFILTVDLTDESSFNNLNKHLNNITTFRKKDSDGPIYIVVTKNDLCNDFKHSIEELKTFCTENKFPAPRITSAKINDNDNCRTPFEVVTADLLERSKAAAVAELKANEKNKINNVFKITDKKIVNEADAREKLITDLNEYRSKVKKECRPMTTATKHKINLYYFKNLQAQHRQQNYDFAKELIDALNPENVNKDAPQDNLETVLNKFLAYRSFSFNYATKSGHHINSNELNNALRTAKRAVADLNAEKKRALKK